MENKKLISLIPNLLTSLALLMGLLAIFNVINSSFNYETFLGFEKPLWWTCIFIYTAAFIDFLDGKIARLLNKDSVFGMHYDSLCDLVSFGLAPSILAYSTYLYQFEKFGLITCIFYVLCVSLRLARFNTLSHDEKESFFIGLPSPMAAGLIVSVVILNLKFNIFSVSNVSYLFLFLIPFVGLLMVSNTIFIKKLKIKGMTKFNSLIIISILSLALLTNIELGSFIFFYFYLFFSLFKYFLFKFRRKISETKESF